MSNGTVNNNNLFSSLISDIKSYNGKDPLLPWLRGIRRMKDSLPPQLLKEKLPRFLQKCAQTFETDRRYRNDLRYLRVWLQLMDFVDDPGAVLRTMEANQIGRKRSIFYQAYALYYEKIKKFEDAEKMYHWGVKNLAEPVADLQSSFGQFLQRMERHKNKRIQRQGGRTTNSHAKCDENKENSKSCLTRSSSQRNGESGSYLIKMQHKTADFNESRSFCGEDTVVVNKFVDTAIVGRSLAEDARHHGLVEPTINTKEAMNAINSMFREPLEPSLVGKKRLHKTEPKVDNNKMNNGFEVFIDENSDNNPPPQESLQIFIDDEENNENVKDSENVKAFVFPNPKDLPSDEERPRGGRPREDTVVFRFVGSTISDERPVVENVCHHGLVEPTVNLKEAMDDINGMFGKPIEFTRKKNRPKRKVEEKKEMRDFLILPDNELNHQPQKLHPNMSSSSTKEADLFEPTVCTKEAMDEINKLFGMPLDF